MRKDLFLIILALGLIIHAGKSYSQLVVTAAAGGTSICTNTATNGSAPGPTTLDTIRIWETTISDIQVGFDTLVLKPPPGWKFWTGTTTGIPFPPLVTDLYQQSLMYCGDSIMLTIQDTGNHHLDTPKIYGIQVQAQSMTAAPGYIYAARATGFAGITTGSTGTNFGNLSVSPATITGTTNVCVSGTATYTDVSTGGTWSTMFPSIATVSATTGIVSGVATGTDTLIYTLPNTCAVKFPFTVIACPAGVHEINGTGDEMILFPNPVVNQLAIQTPDPAYQSITINNLLGQVLLRQTVDSNETTIAVNSLPAGVYLITLHGAAANVVRRFVKE